MNITDISTHILEIAFYHSTLCIIAAIFGSFVKTYAVDNIGSIREIFQQMFFAVFMAIIVLIYGSIYKTSHNWQYIASLVFGFVGINATHFFTRKVSELIISSGKGLEDLGKSLEEYAEKHEKKKRKRDYPEKKSIKDIPKNSTRHNNENDKEE